MHFVNDINFIACGCRRITHPIQHFAHILNACPRGRVHLQHIHMARRHNQFAMITGRGQFYRWAFDGVAFIIQCPRQEPRCRRLTDTAHAGQHKGMSNTAGLKRILKRRNHRLLANHILKGRRAVFPRQNLVVLIGGFFAHSPSYRQNSTRGEGLAAIGSQI